ncbi:hypothetical protein ASPVEDRAFT_393379 [Aspergillus versicolor CBS 583.65]|uniref:DUF7703 domain-containing protein n=1 Tax=Aspergillus versicolor CBS 583.65 TaxID=1036611 RepID=A0A1L9Q3F6_ASPVE|nr:uncharacterized protein ASPVEDRAFT_393379 [Aspergillus versicolor CBS 583.65]OJJ08305.1 hypothetical protein ASPVEDRAFT_393379 [Aspergillus versicolor CBS 583.65]
MSSSLGEPPKGLIGGYQGDSTAVKAIMGALIGISLYNTVELTTLIFTTFHLYRGLYFWSLILSTTLGLIPSGIANTLHYFNIGPLWLAMTLSNIGFYFLVPMQSVVLYSRLHLVLYNQRILRLALYMLIVSAVVFSVSITVVCYGSAFVRTPGWNASYTILERLQVTWFCVQEFVLAALYIRETIKLLRLNPTHSSRRRKIMYELLAINVGIILMDAAVIVIEFLGLYYLQVLVKCAIYSAKLKLEFAVLGKLTAIVEAPHRDLGSADVNGLSGRPASDPIAYARDRVSLAAAHGSKES